MRVGILVIRRKHLHDRIISLRGEVWVHQISLTPPLFIEVPISRQECRPSCICVLGLFIWPLSMVLIFEFGIVLTVWYFLVSHFIENSYRKVDVMCFNMNQNIALHSLLIKRLCLGYVLASFLNNTNRKLNISCAVYILPPQS